MNLSLHLYNVARLDFSPTGAFFRSLLHERVGDPHLTAHWEPRAGSTCNTPHLTRRREPRVWLPEVEHAMVLDFFDRLSVALCKRWIYGLRPIDLIGAERAGWRFCVSLPSGFIERNSRTVANEINVRIDAAAMLEVAQHMLVSEVAPTTARGPEGPFPIATAHRWAGGELICAASIVWLGEGLWDPFVERDLVSISPPGWYWMPSDLLSRELLFEVFGPNVDEMILRVGRIVREFLGPVVHDRTAEMEALDEEIGHLVATVGRRR